MIDANPDEFKYEIIYPQTGTSQRPGGMQPAGLQPDVRVTHIPTGLMAQCGMHRSQVKNREACLAMIAIGMIRP